MNSNFYLSISVIVVFIVSLATGVILYHSKNKKWYSFLASFPFELENEENFLASMIFKIILGGETILMGTSSLIILYFNIDNYLFKVLGLIMFFSSFMFFSLFVIKMIVLKGRILVSSLFQVLVLLSYFFLTILGFSRLQYDFPLAVTIISLVIGIILTILILSPYLISWWRMGKVDEEKNEVVRKNFNPLAFNEWVCIFSFAILFILIIFVK